jgi:hypothetical protein
MENKPKQKTVKRTLNKAEKMATAMIEKRINELVPKKIEIPTKG